MFPCLPPPPPQKKKKKKKKKKSHERWIYFLKFMTDTTPETSFRVAKKKKNQKLRSV